MSASLQPCSVCGYVLLDGSCAQCFASGVAAHSRCPDCEYGGLCHRHEKEQLTVRAEAAEWALRQVFYARHGTGITIEDLLDETRDGRRCADLARKVLLK